MSERRYRIKDLKRSTETKAVYVTNASNSTIYRKPGPVANKLKDLCRTSSSSFSRFNSSNKPEDFEVEVLELQVAERIPADIFYGNVNGQKEKVQAAERTKKSRMDGVAKEVAKFGLTLDGARQMLSRNILDAKVAEELKAIIAEYDRLKSTPVAQFIAS